MKTTKSFSRTRRKRRIRSKVSGVANRPRLVVFRSNNHITAQLIDDTNGKTLVSAHDMKIKKGNKTERAQQVGSEIGKTAASQNIEKCTFDRNGYKYHGRIKALADAAREAGLQF
ncbi:MAG: 50S ribosomal protein L18 [Candidatus Gracilibacteria bacterium]|nr:50S ribosomal protein L18 [bacterium]MDZ4217053.1 50S ribosomal protein L18 [Candidatus Gracilibacteria bacterium]